MFAPFSGRETAPRSGSGHRLALAGRRLNASRRQVRPRLETLEEKLAPAVFLWTGAASAAMSNPANWSTGGQPAAAIPGPADDLVFNGDAASKSVNNDLDGATFQSLQFQAADYTVTGRGLTLVGGVSTTQHASLGVDLNLTPGGHTFFVAPWMNLRVQGALTGAGGLVKSGQGTLTLYAASSYAGPTHLQAGMLLAGVEDVLPATTALTVDDGSAFNLWNRNQTIGSLSGGTSNIDLGRATLTVGDATDTTYNGFITGPGGRLVKQGTGTLNLTNANTYNGPTHVVAGTLRIDGSIEPTPTLVVDAGATLAGRGSIGSIEVAGTVIPGDATNRGTLFVKNARFLPGSTYQVNIAGAEAGRGYGVLSVSGTADFSGATLVATAPFEGTLSTIVRNDGDIPFTTTFSNLADGSSITVSGRTYQADYDQAMGDRAHDAVIRREVPTPIAPPTTPAVAIAAPIATTTQLAVGSNAARSRIILDAAVTAGGGSASGAVIFYANGKVLQRVNVVNGRATLTVATSAVMRKSVQAVFVPANATQAGSASTPVVITPRLVSAAPIRATSVPGGPARSFASRTRGR